MNLVGLTYMIFPIPVPLHSLALMLLGVIMKQYKFCSSIHQYLHVLHISEAPIILYLDMKFLFTMHDPYI
jgi:biotin transporter BioY